MRYAQIREMDISNGKGLGVSLFVQGCDIRCKGCFNKSTWSFNGGKEWTREVKKKFLRLVSCNYVKRVSILGGEPLAPQNVNDVLDLVTTIKRDFPDKQIWLYTGRTIEEIFDYEQEKEDEYICFQRRNIVMLCDILVDGKFIEEQKDALAFRGSRNQRILKLSEELPTMIYTIHDDNSFLKKFEGGKRYVFSALKFNKYLEITGNDETLNLVEIFDGCEVQYIGKPDMALVVNDYGSAYVMPFACVEIPE